MLSIKSEPRVFIVIAWLLTGVMLTGSLLDTLSAADDSTVYVEECLIEFDDDRSDFRWLNFCLLSQIDEQFSPPTWHNVQVFYADYISSIQRTAHLQRGPPRS